LRVRRLRVGDAICVLNGSGLRANCFISEVGRNSLLANINDWIEFDPKPRRLTIASAIPKRDRQRTMVDMLTQLGVAKIIPLECKRSTTPAKAAMFGKWQRYAIEACKQSQNPWLPEIAPSLSLHGLLADMQADAVYMYADINGQKLAQLTNNGGDGVVIIGPEGGFSEQEQLDMCNAGVKRLYLGDHILRTELAGVASATQFFNMQ